MAAATATAAQHRATLVLTCMSFIQCGAAPHPQPPDRPNNPAHHTFGARRGKGRRDGDSSLDSGRSDT